ncbi:MAG: MarR family transcriptional regulator [Myxococcota bacterium]
MSDAGSVRLVLGLLDAAGSIQRRFDRGLAVVRGVSFSEYRLLLALAEQQGRASTRVGLARRVGLSPSAVTRALKPLEKQGYVVTERGPRDARQAVARLTEGGAQLLADCEQVVAEEVERLGLDDAAKEHGIALLGALPRSG